MEYKIENIVATANMGFKIDLGVLKMTYPNDVVYEPEQFVGAFLKIKTEGSKKGPSFTFFNSGKMVITGCKSEEDIKKRLVYVEGLLLKMKPNDTPIENKKEEVTSTI